MRTLEKNKIAIGGLGILMVVLASGCENYREWRENKSKEPASTQRVSDELVPPRKDPTPTPVPTPAESESQAPQKPSRVNPVVTHPSGSIGSGVLMVNRDYISSEEVIRRVRPQLEATAQTYSESSYIPRAQNYVADAVRDIISETLLYQEIASRIGEEQNPAIDKAVDKEVNAIALSDAGGSKVLLERKLRDQGSNMEELKKQLRKQIVTQQYLREKMKPKVIITRDDLWNYYQANQDQFVQPAQVRLAMIEIDPDRYLPQGVTRNTASPLEREQTAAKAKRQIQSLTQDIVKDKDFTELAKAYSTAASARAGGEMGWISKGSYRIRQVEDEAFRLNVGEISRPITVDEKTYVIRLLEYKPENKTPFSQAQNAIREGLEKEIYRRLVMQYLSKLWSKSQIGPIDVFVDTVCSRLPEYESLKTTQK